MKKKISRILGVVLTLALLLSMALVAAPAMALTQPSVTIDTDENVISTVDAGYTIIFTLGQDLEVGDTITLTFPSDTVITAGNLTASVIFATSPGWVGGVWDPTPGATATWVGVGGTTRTITGTVATEPIGQGAQVRIEITAGITNPSSPGDKTLTVKTTDEPTAVTSTAYTIVVPTIPALAGIVSVYNPSDILMGNYTGDNAINAAIGLAGEGYTIKIGKGTYSTDTFNTAAKNVTFVGIDGVAVTIINVAVAIDEEDITLDGLTITKTVTVTADDAIIKNCVLKTATTLIVTSGAGTDLAVTNCTLTTVTNGIDADGSGLKVTGSTFTVASGDWGIIASNTATVSGNCVFSGAGVGIKVDAAVAVTIKDSTFSGMNPALDIDDGTVTVGDNVKINNSTGYAVDIAAAADKVIILNSEINNTAATKFAIYSLAPADTVWVLFNSIVGNTKNISSTNACDATHNWWGVATGPASGSCTAAVDTSGYLGAKATGVFVLSDTSLTAKTTVGVNVSVTTAAGIIAAAKYSANPKTAPVLPVVAGTFVDVYVGDPGTPATDVVIIKLYASVTDRTQALVWNELAGVWAAASNQGVSTFGGYVWVIVDATTIPALEDLAGIPIVLVTTPAPAPPVVTLTAPAAGATDTAVTNVAFTWNSVAGATSYKLTVSANADLSSPIALQTLPGTAFTYAATLAYSSPYYWKVTALKDATVLGESQIATFTTMDVVVPPVTPTLTVEIPDITLPAPTITTVAPTIEMPPTPVYVWAIVGIGAVLSIAVIVLIVRTRRIV